MRKLSTGDDSTLGNWKKLAVPFFGEEHPAVKFLDSKIDEQGEDEEVVVDESQFINALWNMKEGDNVQP